ncbi:bifunctional sugar-1-phosphate nucleotidylyltransferase/acetyltransferase [Halohasta salina]|uniref:bifunctional sugar-1-phosphate nucleotidylyltransferase/acetyltransferase n=1 Tax=Halohasta salina TaxID=2961621 RepID=UPI0020A4CF78|nr:bifunctional sugar-1-phosphate nucleotidylyltransferase/acetyltransferase [Halohasta salina]
MQTVVLAAGEGTRMRPLTAAQPKPMLPVAGKPLLEHTLDRAVDAGADRLVVVVGYESDRVRDHFGTRHAGVDVEYAVQTEQRGTADAVNAAAPLLDNEPFVVLNGDALYDQGSLDTLYSNGPAVGSYRVDNPSAYGVLQLAADDDTRVTGVVEKPANPESNLINTGAYVFPAAAHDLLTVETSDRGELELTDVLEAVCDQCSVTAVPFKRWLDVGRPWELLAANEWLLESPSTRLDGEVHEGATLDGPVVVEAGATIKAGVTIEGPVYVDRGATVGPNAYVRGSTYLGPETKVGNAVEVKNSVLMTGATVGHLSYVGDSVLGRRVNFGAGTKVANLRHDGEPVKLTVKGERVSTGRRKLGVIVGDDAKTGINTSLNAGVVLGTGATTQPGEVLTRDRSP